MRRAALPLAVVLLAFVAWPALAATPSIGTTSVKQTPAGKLRFAATVRGEPNRVRARWRGGERFRLFRHCGIDPLTSQPVCTNKWSRTRAGRARCGRLVVVAKNDDRRERRRVRKCP